MMLEMVLQTAAERGLRFSTGVLTAADALLDAGRLAESRMELARQLSGLGSSLQTNPSAVWDQVEILHMRSLLTDCELDSDMAQQAYRVLSNCPTRSSVMI